MIATAVSVLCAASFLYEPLLSIDDQLDVGELALFYAGAVAVSRLLSKRTDYGLIR